MIHFIQHFPFEKNIYLHLKREKSALQSNIKSPHEKKHGFSIRYSLYHKSHEGARCALGSELYCHIVVNTKLHSSQEQPIVTTERAMSSLKKSAKRKTFII